MPEKIEIDLFDPTKDDNQKFDNLIDETKWNQLIEEYNRGLGTKSLSELFQELLESR